MNWRPVAEATPREMAQHAAHRRLVRLRNGRIATLVQWPTPFGRFKGQSCRLETRFGTRFRVPVGDVESFAVEEITDD